MAADLTVGGYGTYQDLCGYMEGSAAVIGTLLAPILEASDPPAAREYARQLGLASQLTNFIPDVAEDYRRGRVYLPAEDLERFGVRRQDLAAPTASPAVQKLLAFKVARAREHSPGRRTRHRAADGLLPALCPGRLRPVWGILDEVERAGYQVLDRRVAVPGHRRLRVAGRHWAAAQTAARAECQVTITTPGSPDWRRPTDRTSRGGPSRAEG
jgi:phytoene synthase